MSKAEHRESETDKNMVNAIMLKDSDKSTEEEVFEEDVSEDEKLLFCDTCDFKRENDETIKDHMKSKHKKCKPCDVCGKYFKSNKSLTAHQQKEYNNREDLRKKKFCME